MTLVALISLAVVAAAESATPPSPFPAAPSEYRAEFLARSPLKDIAAPTAANVKGGGGSSGADHDDWRMRVETGLSELAVLDYYAEELIKRGFVLNPKSVEGSIAFQTGTYVAPDGLLWHVLLFASRGVSPETPQVDLSLRLTRLAED